MRQTIQVVLENKHGALMRVVGILAAKGSNIEALKLVVHPSKEGISQMQIVADVEPWLHARVIQEMNRLVNVLCARDVSLHNSDLTVPSIRTCSLERKTRC